MARLPVSIEEPFRPGHLARELPDGYLESLRDGRNRITDPALRAWYDRLRLVRLGPALRPGALARDPRAELHAAPALRPAVPGGGPGTAPDSVGQDGR